MMTVPGVGGRPLRFETPEALQKACDAYFASCWHDIAVTKGTGKNQVTTVENKQYRPYTVTDLARFIDIGRSNLFIYAKREPYRDTLSRAMQRVEGYTERNLHNGRNPSGAQFSLINNFKQWEHRKVVKTDVTVTHEIGAGSQAMLEQLNVKALPDPDVVEGEVLDD